MATTHQHKTTSDRLDNYRPAEKRAADQAWEHVVRDVRVEIMSFATGLDAAACNRGERVDAYDWDVIVRAGEEHFVVDELPGATREDALEAAREWMAEHPDGEVR